MSVETKRMQFWLSILAPFRHHAAKILSAGPLPFNSAHPEILDNAFSAFISQLEPLILPVIVDYITTKKSIEPENKAIYYTLFDKGIEDIQNIFEQFYSPVIQQIYNLINQFMCHFRKMCFRIFSDWTEIKTKFNLSDKDILYEMKLFSGDPHGQGEQTALIIFNDGNSGFAYKPVDLSIIGFFIELSAFAKSNLHFESIKLPGLIIKKTSNDQYGYLDYVPYVGLTTSTAQVEEVYNNFGKLLAVARFFGIADGHDENIVISLPDVYWIDLENSFHFRTAEQREKNQFHPLEITGLLLSVRKETTLFGIRTGLQGGNIPHISMTRPIAYNDGTDDLYVRYFKTYETPEIQQKNRIHLNQVPCRPEDSERSILEGYRDTMKALVSNKVAILDFITQYFDRNEVTVRYISKATASYIRFIHLVNHVVSITKMNALSIIRKELLVLTTCSKQEKDFIVQHECIDICKNVIPYFYRSSKSNALFHISGDALDGFFEQSLLSDIVSHINQLDIPEIDSDCIFIREALESTRHINTWDDFKLKINYPEFNLDTAQEPT